jgi:hypothetical protein
LKALIAILGAVFLVTFAGRPLLGAGWFWDLGNGLGFAAFGGLLYLTISSGRHLDVQLHQVLAYAVLFLTLAHVCWFLLGDPAVVEYVKFGAPGYMWLGIASLLLLFVLVASALMPDRLRLHKDYSIFKYWHRVIAIATIFSATYHIVVSNFYVNSKLQILLFAAIAVAASFGQAVWRRSDKLQLPSLTMFLSSCFVAIIVFAVVRNLPL